MDRPISAQKEVLAEKIEKGEIILGEEVVPSTHNSYTVDNFNSIVEKTATVHARKISLSDIRKKLLSKHEKMNLLRKTSDQYFDSLTNEEVITKISQLHECPPSNTDKGEVFGMIYNMPCFSAMMAVDFLEVACSKWMVTTITVTWSLRPGSSSLLLAF